MALNNGTVAAKMPDPEEQVQESYQILNQYHSKPSKLRVIGVGAGATGTKTLVNMFFIT